MCGKSSTVGQIPARPVQGCFLRKGAAGVARDVERVRALGLVMQVRSYVCGKGAVEGSGTLRRLVGEGSGALAAIIPARWRFVVVVQGC